MNASLEGGLATAFAKLGLPADADARTVRQAYARLLKQIDPTTELEAFQSLREAYDRALVVAKGRAAATVDVSPATVVAVAEPAAPAVPALANEPDRVDGASLADTTFDAFASRLTAGVASAADGEALLRQALDQLVSLEAGARFERRVADLLARGWLPGHEFLFDAACTTFGWADDRRHLRGLAASGELLQEAIIEKQVFWDQPADLVDRQYRLIRRLRDASPPSTTLRRDEAPLLKVLVRRYPHWLSIVTSKANIEQWLGGPQALQAALAMPEASDEADSPGPFQSIWRAIGLVLWLAWMIWHHFGQGRG